MRAPSRYTKAASKASGFLVILAMILSSAPISLAGAPVVPGPAGLVLSAVPPRLPADGQAYGALVVSLVNSSGLPVVAAYDVHVYLSSSLPSVGNVSPSVTIHVGESYAVANMTTSKTPGSATVTASATGLRTASVLVQTLIPSGFPDHLVAFAIPPIQLARAKSYGEVVVQVQDDLGIPARTASPVIVSVTSSDIRIVQVSNPSLTILTQQSVASENYTAETFTGSATITTSASGFASGSAIVEVVKAPPLVLKVTTEPDLISPGSTGRIVVALTDKNGDPAEAPADLLVFLTSSNLAAANVSGTTGLNPVEITIPKDKVFAETKFVSARTGNATVTASAHGLSAGFALVVVNPPRSANELRLFLAPNPFPSTESRLPTIGIGLAYLNRTTQKLSPSVAKTTIPVVVTASDNATGKVIESITVPFEATASYAVGTFNSTLLPSTAIITAAAQNLTSAQAALTTLRPVLPIGPPPTRVVVSPVAPSLPADGNQYQGLLVSLEDSSGGPAVAPVDVSVQLSLDRPDVLQLSSENNSVTVPANQSYSIVLVRTLSVEATVNVTAESPGYSSSWALLSTRALSPARLALYASPSPAMLSSVGAEAMLVVQLQDASGSPARARAQTQVTVTSSNNSLLAAPLLLTIPAFTDYVVASLYSAVPTSSVLTAISPGLGPGNVSISSFRLPAKVSITSTSSLFLNGTAILTVTATLLNAPVQNATVSWYASSGTLDTQQSKTSAAGVSSVTWTPSRSGVVTYSVTVSSPVFGSRNLAGTFFVIQPIVRPPPSFIAVLFGYLPYIGAGAAAVLVLVFVLWRRRRGTVKEEVDAFSVDDSQS